VRDLTGAGLVAVDGVVTEKAQLAAGSFLRLGRLELVLRVRSSAAGPSGTMATPSPGRPSGVVATRTSGVGRQSAVSTPEALGATGVQGHRPAGTPAQEPPLEATAKRPTPYRQPGIVGVAAPEFEGEPQPPLEATVLSRVLPPGTVIDGRYHVVAKLAEGGMGEVYRAEHVELGKAMAVKVMLPELSRDPEFVARFKREAIAASRIGQQNIVDISDFGRTTDGRFYFVMEYLDGKTLASVVHREGALPVARAVGIVLQVARALAAAHAQGIVHRDLKPENVMLVQRPGQPDFVKVLDFGIAKVSYGHGQGGQTAVGMVVGTPQYMSPEQAKGLAVDARSDIYSLGLILYELLTGRPVFTGETPALLMVKHITEAPPPLQPGPLGDVPAELERLVFQMLEKEPGARPQTMEAVVQVLEGVWARARAEAVTGKQPVSATATGSEVRGEPGPAHASGVMARASGGYRSAVSSAATGPQVDPDVPPLPRRSAKPFVIGGVVVAALAAGVVALMGGKERGQDAVVKEELPAPPPAQEQPEKVVAPAVQDEAPRPEADKPTVEKVVVTFKSVPEKVEVYEGDVFLGVTPLTLDRSKGAAPVELTFQAKGYKKQTRKVGFVTTQEVHIELEKQGKAPTKTDRSAKSDELKESPY
jgi:serine/threonine-protein kinase